MPLQFALLVSMAGGYVWGNLAESLPMPLPARLALVFVSVCLQTGTLLHFVRR
jgi:hypothetical protein